MYKLHIVQIFECRIEIGTYEKDNQKRISSKLTWTKCKDHKAVIIFVF